MPKSLKTLPLNIKLPAIFWNTAPLMKLKTTYVDNLPKLLGKDNKLHTHFNQIVNHNRGAFQALTLICRIFPLELNFQTGIRRLYPLCASDYSIIAADYSQIELRLFSSYIRR